MKVPPVVIELFKRIASDNPKFFKWIQVISAVVAVVAFIPDLLAFLDIAAPSWLDVLHDKTVKVGALISIFIAQLPNADKK
jgi:hypothetical protein